MSGHAAARTSPPPTPSCCSAPPAISPSASCSPRSTTSSSAGELERPGDRRGPQRLDRRGLPRARPRVDPRRTSRSPDEAIIAELMRAARPDPGRLRRPAPRGRRCADTLDAQRLEARRVLHGDPADDVPDRRRVAGVGRAQRARAGSSSRSRSAATCSRRTELNATLHTIFPEERIFRIDHYLGKESVEDLLVFRFSNTLLEPVWNRDYVRSVQVTMAETIGVEGRGSFYDCVGAIRDVLQNHLLQVVSLLAMEPPVGPEPPFLQDEKAKVLAAMEPIDPNEHGPRAVRRVPRRAGRRAATRRPRRSSPPGSRSTRGGGPACRGTCASARRSPQSATEAVVEFREPPRLLFDEAGGPAPDRNLVRFRLGTNDGVTFTLQAKTPGPHLDSQTVDVSVDFAAALGERRRPTSACSATRSPARRAASPARTSSSRPGGSCSRRSTSPARCTRTSAARGVRPRPTASSTATPGSTRRDRPGSVTTTQSRRGDRRPRCRRARGAR